MSRLVCIEELNEDQLGVALAAQVEGNSWACEAGIGLLVAHARWLARPEFRRAIDVWQDEDGLVRAWIDWERVEFDMPASSSESAILALVGSLFGKASHRPLSWLVSSLDGRNSMLVTKAMGYACCGPVRGGVQ
jgi:hypothetical protein